VIINVDKFKEIVTKATLNFSIESVQLNFTKEEIKSKMISFANDAITILKVKNDVLPSMAATDEVQFNFVEPSQSIMPYFNLIEGETIVKIGNEKISVITGNQTSNLFFCSPTVVNVLQSDGPKNTVPQFHTCKVDDDLMASFEKIKKIGSRFNKVYFGVDKTNFYIETTDKTNKFSNGLKITLAELKQLDISLCFDYRNMFNLVSIIDSSFSMNFYYMKENKLGMLKAVKDDESEAYFLMSKMES
jgi:hypothetical protein